MTLEGEDLVQPEEGPMVATEMDVTMKLFINKERNEVIFGELSKYGADIIFGFLTIPMALLRNLGVGSIAKLAQSLEKLDPKYMSPGGCAQTLEERMIGPSQGPGYGYKATSFFLTDNMEIKPITSAIDVMDLVDDVIQARNHQGLEIPLTMDLVMQMLEASVLSKTVLTYVFLKGRQMDLLGNQFLCSSHGDENITFPLQYCLVTLGSEPRNII